MIRFPLIKQAILAPKSPATNLLWLVMCIVVPTAIRWVIDRGAAGVPFVTYFPAIMVAALFLDWRWAAVTAFCSAVVANRIFRPGHTIVDFGTADFIMAGLFMLSCVILINVGALVRRLLRDLEVVHGRDVLLNTELRHRVKNLLAMVQSMATLTHRTSGPEMFAEDFSGRVAAMARVTDIASAREPAERQLAKLVDMAVAPFVDRSNFAISGPDVMLPQPSCIPLALALHELCTNAVKYGALSVPDGRVSLGWAMDRGIDAVTILWQEEGGPPVEKPVRRGVGSMLLHPQKGLDEVEMRFLPGGLQCEIRIRSDEGH